MITIEVSGIKFEGFTSISVSKSIEAISGSFSFSATSNNVSTFPIKRSQSCKVFIDGNPVINGFIDSIDVSYDSGSHSISIKGRDRTCDIIDSTVVGKKEFKAPITLTQIIRSSLDDNGLQAISIINNAGSIEAFKEGEFVAAEIGQTLFEFIESYARKRQVLLTTNGNGDVVITRAGTSSAIVALQNISNGNSNNIKSANITYNEIARFNTYTIQSQQNPSALSFGSDVTLGNVVEQKGVATDSSIRSSRKIEMTSKTSDSSVDLSNLASWNANLRRARSADYSVVVQGHYQDDNKSALWQSNQLVKVQDDFSDVNATLLIRAVEYNVDLSSGSTTTISLVAKDAYTLQANIDQVEARANKQGNNLVFEDGATL